MVTLAKGVQQMANMEVVTNEVVNAGTKDAVLVPGTVIKLDQSHFEAAATNIGAILSNITQPLLTFGKALGEGSGMFSDGYMQTGVEFFGVLTESMGTLAQGVQGMANLEVIENEVIDAGTKDAKIVPGKVRKLTKDDFTNSALNMAALLANVTGPLTTFGRALSGDTGDGGVWGMFTDAVSPNYMQIGLQSLGTLTSSLTELASGMAKMANMEFVEQEVINAGTKDAKIVPGKVNKVTPEMMTKAAESMSALLTGVTAPLTEFGRALSGDKGDGSIWGMIKDMVSPDYMKMGLDSLGTLTSSLTGLSEGMSKMANMEFVEQEVINPGTKDAKLVPGKVTKVSPEMMTKAAENMGALLTGMTAPLTEFGRALSGDKGDGSIWGMITDMVSPDYMKMGLDSLGTLSESLGTLGEGIINMASMSVVVNEVVDDPKTGQRKVVPGKVITLNPDHFKMAGEGVAAILTGLTQPLTDFGKAMEDGSGLFSGGYIEKGLEGLSMLSESLGGLAEGVIKIGSGQFVMQKIINPGTKDAKLVPGEVMTLNETHFALARQGIITLLEGLAKPLGDFGKAWNGGGEFGSFMFSDVKAGVEGLAAVSEPIGDLADAIIKLGGGQVVIQEVVNGKLRPGKVLDMAGVLESAKTTLLDILTVFPTAFVTAGTYMQDNDSVITSVVGYLENDIVPSMELILEAAGLYSKTISTMEVAAGKKVPIDALILSLDMSMSVVGKTLKKDMDSVALGNFTTFNTEMKRLSDMASPFERFTKAFTQFSKDMGTFSKNFKVMTPEGIDAYKVWTDAVVTVAKTDFSAIESKIQAMRDIAASIYKAGDPEIPNGDNEQTEQQKQEAIKNKNNNVVTNPDPNSPAGGGGGGGGGANASAIAAAIKSALSTMKVETMYVTYQK